MITALTWSIAYALAVIIAFTAYRARNARRAASSQFKPTPWDEFRRRTVQATGCQTVHEALRQGLVQSLPGGWLEFDGLAHHADETATVADLAQARMDAAMQSEPDTNPGSDWERPKSVEVNLEPVVEVSLRDLRTSCAPEPEPRFQPGDWVFWANGYGRKVFQIGGGHAQISPCSAAASESVLLRHGCVGSEPAELYSPWVGRSVHTGNGTRSACVWDDGADLWLYNGDRVARDEAELHWDDVRPQDHVYFPAVDTDYEVEDVRAGQYKQVGRVFWWDFEDAPDVPSLPSRFTPPVVTA